jgi:hypothetical protein
MSSRCPKISGNVLVQLGLLNGKGGRADPMYDPCHDYCPGSEIT